MPATYCQHGVALFGDPVPECIDCKIVWYQSCLDDAARRVQTCNEQLRGLLAKRMEKGPAR